MTDTQRWPFVQAKYYKIPSTPRTPRVIVVHDMEAPEANNTAENVAKYFQHPDYPSSAHICVDNNSIVQSVRDSHIAYAAPGCNHDGIQIELAGFGSQTRNQWLDVYSVGVLAMGADATSQYCLKYSIPAVHLTNAQLKAGKKGIVGHYQVSEVYKKSDHSDPGIAFPWDIFVSMVQQFIKDRTQRIKA